MSEEIVMQILSRLSPKSLMRFKCVRKSWYTLITSPSFVVKHLSTSIRNKHTTCILCKRFVSRSINSDEMELIYSLITFFNYDYGDQPITHSVVEDIDIPFSTGEMTRDRFYGDELVRPVCMGHCDGIICLTSSKIVLWNPATKEFKILPPSWIPGGAIDSIGFGYDAKSKDYKVIGIASHDEDRISDREFVYPPKVEVYTLSTDSWTYINTDSLETETTNFFPELFQMYFMGICYWTGSEQQKEFMNVYDRDDEQWIRQLIVFFDMSDEVFDHILFPYSLYEPVIPSLQMQVTVWNESIALFGQYRFGGSDDVYGLWVIEDSVKGYWIKHFTFEPIVGTQNYLKFWKSDEILMVANDKRIFSYNINSEEIKYLSIESMNPDQSEAVFFVSSIVPVILG